MCSFCVVLQFGSRLVRIPFSYDEIFILFDSVFTWICFIGVRGVRMEYKLLKEKVREYNKKDVQFYGNIFAKINKLEQAKSAVSWQRYKYQLVLLFWGFWCYLLNEHFWLVECGLFPFVCGANAEFYGKAGASTNGLDSKAWYLHKTKHDSNWVNTILISSLL